MAQFRQPGSDRFPSRNTHDSDEVGGVAGGEASWIHLHHHQIHHSKPITVRLRRHKRRCVHPPAALTVLLLLLLLVALSASFLLLSSSREIHQRSVRVVPKTLRFGHVAGVGGGRASRYWDRDDRRRDQDYGEVDDDVDPDRWSSAVNTNIEKESRNGGGGLYNEGGRKELDAYKREYEASENSGGGIDRENDDYDDGIDSEDEKEGPEEEEMMNKVRETNEVVRKNEKIGSPVLPTRIVHGGGRRRRTEVEKVIGSSDRKSGSKRKPKRNFFRIFFIFGLY